jgi:ligand-binding sensor domain-containing protein
LVKYFLSLLLFFACYLTTLAQQARQYSFKHFSTLNGLVSNSANSIVQDKDGFIWIATTHGLQRYDGNTFLTFKASESDSKSIPTTNIISLFTDKRNRLWLIGDNNAIGTFDTKKFEFKKAELPGKIITNSHQHFVEWPTGELILLSNNGFVYEYNESRNRFIEANNKIPLPKGWKLSHITWDVNIRKFWISTDSGLVQLNPLTKIINHRGNNISKDPIINAVGDIKGLTDLNVDKEGGVFGVIQEQSSIAPRYFYYDPKLKQARIGSLSEQIGVWHIHTDGFLLQKKGRIWLYGIPFLAEWQNGKNAFSPIIKGASGLGDSYFNRIGQAFEDRENNIWVATDNGVLLFNPDAQIFSSYDLIRPGEDIKYDLVQAVAESKDGRIFVGTWRGGIYGYDKDLNPIPLPTSLRSNNHELSVADMGLHTRTGTIWITQEKGKIDVFDPITNKVTKVVHPFFGASTIRQITQDTAGNIWFGTNRGDLIKWNYKTSKGNYREGYELIYKTGSVIRKVHFDYQGYIWVGTGQNGLLKIDTRTNKLVHHFTIEGKEGERLFINSVKDISYYNDTTLLIAAGCLNIINKKTNKIKFFGTKEGLPSNTLESVQRDSENIIWMGMTNGISRLNLAKNIISYYDRRDGLNYDKFIQTGVQQLSGGRIFFFTDHNFMVFDPSKVSPQGAPPKPYITSVKIAGIQKSVEDLLKAKRVYLKYSNTSIGIDFSAMSFLQQRKLHYHYKMEGLDKEWIHTDRPITANYNYLSPGQYTFLVKTETIDGITNENMAAFTIIVRAPFWQTWWFYALVVLILMGLWFLLDRERINKRKSLLEVRSEIANNLHNDISVTLSDINVLSEMAKIKADKNVEQSKDFIDQINDKSRYTITAMEDMLWSIDPANDSMKKTLSRIKDYTNELQTTSGAEIDVIIDNRLEAMDLEMKLRHDIFYLYKEAITLLVKGDDSKQIFVNLNVNQSKNSLIIEFLSSSPENVDDFKLIFMQSIHKRIRQVPITLDFVTENKHMSVVFQVRLK